VTTSRARLLAPPAAHNDNPGNTCGSWPNVRPAYDGRTTNESPRHPAPADIAGMARRQVDAAARTLCRLHPGLQPDDAPAQGRCDRLSAVRGA
jgi:hypothetical protein